MRTERQEKILEIVEKTPVSTQKELVEALARAGFPATQATVSRDIRTLGLVREQTPGGRARYARPKVRTADEQSRLRNIFRECVVSVDRAQNLVVVKTLPGLAPAACSAIDKMNIRVLVGTIAGDDTAFLALRDDDSAEEIRRRMAKLLE